jgi:nitrous oxidase accessory protein
MRAEVLTIAGLLEAACAGSAAPLSQAKPVAAPDECRVVVPGTALRDLAATAAPGTHLCLAPGHHAGPVRIGSGVTVWGPHEAVIARPEGGTVVELAAGAALLGASVDGAGGVFDREDAAVRVAGDDVRVEGVTVVNAVFGVLAERVRRATIRGNVVIGDRAPTMGLRGDPIRLWEVRDSVVDDNVVIAGRDVLVWYSDGNRIEHNRITGSRYGTHLMYSSHNHVAGNTYAGDIVGMFVMYSHDVVLDGNVIADATGAAGMGVGLKDSGDVVVSDNVFVHDQTGLYIDATPLDRGETLTVDRNLFGRCDAALIFHSDGSHDVVRDNDFIADATIVRVDGGGDARAAAWTGNYFDDYAGYDLDGDGRGDLPYELRSFETELTDRVPSIGFFRGTPSLELAEAITRVVPMYAPTILLVDPRPRMSPRAREVVHAD